MLLAEPNRTPYDLNFEVFGIPIRVHPLFFLLPLLLSRGALSSANMNVGVGLLVVCTVFFVSILVHELGHSLAFRYYGVSSHITLYWLGGLAVPDGTSWGRTSNRGAGTPLSQIVISLAGPFAGFALAGVFAAIAMAMGAGIELGWEAIFPSTRLVVPEGELESRAALWTFLGIGLWINIFWNLLNLMPVIPLDGGQVSRQIFAVNDPWNGIRNATILSIVVGGLIAVWGLSRGDHFMGIMFGMLAFSNYQSLAMTGTGGFGGGRPW